MRARIVIGLIMLLAVVSTMASAQAVPAAGAVVPQVVPQLVNFSGVLSDLNGQPLSGVVGVTFLLYKDETGDRRCGWKHRTSSSTRPDTTR